MRSTDVKFDSKSENASTAQTRDCVIFDFGFCLNFFHEIIFFVDIKLFNFNYSYCISKR